MAYYVFDCRYFDLKRLYYITEVDASFVISQTNNPLDIIIEELDTKHNENGINFDQITELKGYYTIN